jgi:hypothetical protein
MIRPIVERLAQGRKRVRTPQQPILVDSNIFRKVWRIEELLLGRSKRARY